MTVSLTKGIRSTPTDAAPITPAAAGCWFAGSSSRTGDELNAAVILAARAYGFDITGQLYSLCQDLEGWCIDPDDAEWLSDSAQSAENYLNDLAPDGYVFLFDDGFYLTVLHDVEGADPSECECGANHSDDAPGFALYV